MSFTDSAAVKSGVTSGIMQEAIDNMLDLNPVHVPRGSRTMIASSSSVTASAATLGVQRNASSNMFNDIFAVTPRRNRRRVTATDLQSAVDSDDSEVYSDLSDDSIATSAISSERIQGCNSPSVNIGGSRVNAPDSRQRPTTELYIKMVLGPKVNIVVGPEKKSFELPKDLLAYYSPVFDRSFNGNFIEDQTQTMELPEDTVEDFEVLVEYVFHHGVGDKLSISKHGQHAAEHCISFLKYADKYDLGYVSTLVYGALRPALIDGGASAFNSSFIEVVFSLTEDGNCLRELMADAALSFQGETLGNYRKSVKINFEKQEAEVEGFTSALYRQLKQSGVSCRYNAPFYPKIYRDFNKI
ncbi:hypothetical protein BPOR_0248g00040 [Botrytis porri]|uniref:BTB domain-containing protein n=1 Tax=Botrytis porri TaxID=87229 RepID=A0A4Z1KNQ7_9HELO|nr:hypothetical protein BPOR_0248g00040 [Botrytis porri]